MLLKQNALFLSLTCLAMGQFGFSAEPAISDKSTKVSYYHQIRPIIQVHCQGCHQPAKAGGDYVMTSHARLLQGDGIISPGKPDASVLIDMIQPDESGEAMMPKGAKALPGASIDLIKQWIVQGAKDDSPESSKVVVDAENPPAYSSSPVVTALEFSPDGQTLAVSGHHEVLLLNAETGRIATRLIGLSERIQSLAFSPDGTMLAVTGGTPCLKGEVQVWNLKDHSLVQSINVTYDTVYGASWSKDSALIAFGCADNTVRAIDVKSGKQVLYQGAHSDWVLDTIFSTDSSHLISVSRDMSMKLTHVKTQRFIDNITSITPGALKGGLQTVDRHPTRDELLIGGSDGTPKIYKTYRTQKRVIGDDFNHIHTFPAMSGRVFAARYSKDGTRIVVGSSLDGKGDVRVYFSTFENAAHRVIHHSVLPTLFGRGMFSPVALGEFQRGLKICDLEGERGAVYAVCFHPDGAYIASAGFDGVIRYNDAWTGALIKEFVPFPLDEQTASSD